MDEVLTRIWTDLVGRLSGPLTLRLVLQPAMATFLAVRDGFADARENRPAYLWSIFTRPDLRRRLIEDGFQAISKVVVVALLLDAIYQYIVFRRIYPFEVVDVAIILAIGPYCLLRGPANRLMRRWKEA